MQTLSSNGRTQDTCKVSIIIPAFNEAETIGTLLEDLIPLVDNQNCEIIVVNDASTDATADIVANYPSVKKLTNRITKAIAPL